jgi:hypothetical protein
MAMAETPGGITNTRSRMTHRVNMIKNILYTIHILSQTARVCRTRTRTYMRARPQKHSILGTVGGYDCICNAYHSKKIFKLLYAWENRCWFCIGQAQAEFDPDTGQHDSDASSSPVLSLPKTVLRLIVHTAAYVAALLERVMVCGCLSIHSRNMSHGQRPQHLTPGGDMRRADPLWPARLGWQSPPA